MMDDHYQLKIGEGGAEQLDALDAFYGQESRRFLSQIGLHQGMKIADIGCGAGHLSLWLAQQIAGNGGRVVAIDANQDQVEVAAQRAQQMGLDNIDFAVCSADALDAYAGQFDLTFCRWLLIHLQNPKAAVESMAATVKPGGILACEVGDLQTNRFMPEFKAAKKLIQGCIASLKRLGNDVDIGCHVVKHFLSLPGFEAPQAQLSQGVLIDPDAIKRFCRASVSLLENMSEPLVNANLLTVEECQEIDEALKHYEPEIGTVAMLSRVMQIYTRRHG